MQSIQKQYNLGNFYTAKHFAERHINGKQAVFSCWLLSELYQNERSPFFQFDSAYAYAKKAWLMSETIKKWNRYPPELNSHICTQRSELIQEQWDRLQQKPSLTNFRIFLSEGRFLSDTLRAQIQIQYEKLFLDSLFKTRQSQSLEAFLLQFPSSIWKPALKDTLDRWLVEQTLAKQSLSENMQFLKYHPVNLYRTRVLDSVFNQIVITKDTLNMKSYVTLCDNNFQKICAWQELYKMYWFYFKSEAPGLFILQNPEAPQLKELQNDLDAETLRLWPLQQNDSTASGYLKFGYVDTSGTWKIPPMFDVAEPFYNMRALVSSNDSLYFITKSARKINTDVYEEAFSFIHPITPVKKNNRWHWLYLSGHSRELSSVEIISHGKYGSIFKKDQLLGLMDQQAQVKINNQFDKISDFNYCFATAVIQNTPGLLHLSGKFKAMNAEWIGPVQSNGQFIFKRGNQFGIADTALKEFVSELDYAALLDSATYLIVKNGLYGFFDASGCYIRLPQPSYNPVWPDSEFGKRGLLRWENEKTFGLVIENDFKVLPKEFQIRLKALNQPWYILNREWIYFKKPEGFELWNLNSSMVLSSDTKPEYVAEQWISISQQNEFRLYKNEVLCARSERPFYCLGTAFIIAYENQSYSVYDLKGTLKIKGASRLQLLDNSTLWLVYNNKPHVLYTRP